MATLDEKITLSLIERLNRVLNDIFELSKLICDGLEKEENFKKANTILNRIKFCDDLTYIDKIINSYIDIIKSV
jgi:hypothetical protein